MDRREFLETSALIAGGALLRDASAAGKPSQAAGNPMVGIQVGAVSFVDEGTEAVLDNLQRLGAVNTVFAATFTYGRGIAGRQVPGQPLPDHGKQEYDTNFRGGNFATPHPQYYRDTSIAPEKAPDHPGYDILGDVIPAAHRRGMKVIAWFEDVIARDVPGSDRAREVAVDGKPGSFVCHRNPNTRAFWRGLVEDYLRSYDVDGLMWGSERQGPLGNTLGTNHGGVGAGGSPACFCQYCTDAAKKTGLDVERARQAYRELSNWAMMLRDAMTAPADGSFVTFWRLMTKYPELLAWERLWNEGLNDIYRDLYRLAHEIAPSKGIGWHVWHNNSFSPFYRAEQDYKQFSEYSDFLKVVMYNLCGGERLAQYIRNVQNTLFRDLPPEQILVMTLGEMHYPAPPFDRLAAEGLPAEYVLRETRRAIAGAAARVNVWPGIDIDIPTARTSKKTTPDDVYQAVKAAFQGGAPGVLLSRKYSEMKLANLGGAGRAIRER
jgi:hypothetical protein